jgi:hypothetical protein
MDPTDSFWQHLDSEDLLKRHGAELATEAREVLARDPAARVAGMITAADSRDAAAMRTAISQASGQAVPEMLMVGLVARQAIEPLLAAYVGDAHWKEEPWQQQRMLPVVVSTRDGYRFGFFSLDAAAGGEAHSP